MQAQWTVADVHNLVEIAAIVLAGATFVVSLMNKNNGHEIKESMEKTATELKIHTAQDDLKFLGVANNQARTEGKVDKLDEKMDDISEVVHGMARNGSYKPHPHPHSTDRG